MTCLPNFGRMILILFNVIFVIAGIAILGLCIFLKVNETSKSIQDIIGEHNDAKNFSSAIIVLVVLGASIVLISSLGCCSAIFENRCLLGMYIFLLSVITIAEIGAGIFVAVEKKKIRSHIAEASYHIIEEKYNRDKSITKTVDILQAKLKCCGANNYTDYLSLVLKVGHVPLSCCVLKNNDLENPVPLNTVLCEAEAVLPFSQTGKYLHTKGCVNTLVSLVKKYSGIILGVALGIAAFEIFLIIVACCICHASRSEDRIGLIH